MLSSGLFHQPKDARRSAAAILDLAPIDRCAGDHQAVFGIGIVFEEGDRGASANGASEYAQWPAYEKSIEEVAVGSQPVE